MGIQSIYFLSEPQLYLFPIVKEPNPNSDTLRPDFPNNLYFI